MHHAKIDNYLIRESKLLISTKKLNKKSYFFYKKTTFYTRSPCQYFCSSAYIKGWGSSIMVAKPPSFLPGGNLFRRKEHSNRFPFSSFYRFPLLWRHVIRVASSFLLATSFSSTTYHDVSESPTRSPLQKGKWMFTVSHRLFTALLSSLPIKIRGINR